MGSIPEDSEGRLNHGTAFDAYANLCQSRGFGSVPSPLARPLRDGRWTKRYGKTAMRWPRFVPAGPEPRQARNTCIFGRAASGRSVPSCNRISDRTSPRKDVQSNFSRQSRVVPEYPGFRDTLSGIREADLDAWAAFVVGVLSGRRGRNRPFQDIPAKRTRKRDTGRVSSTSLPTSF